MSVSSLIPFFLINEIVSPFGRLSVNFSSLFASFSSASQCQQYREQASVLENQPTGTFVLQVHAVDADEGANGKVKYGLMHRDSAMPAFRIHPDTGRVHMDCQGLSSRDFTGDSAAFLIAAGFRNHKLRPAARGRFAVFKLRRKKSQKGSCKGGVKMRFVTNKQG